MFRRFGRARVFDARMIELHRVGDEADRRPAVGALDLEDQAVRQHLLVARDVMHRLIGGPLPLHRLEILGPIIEGSRSEESSVGTECVRTCSSRWSPYH